MRRFVSRTIQSDIWLSLRWKPDASFGRCSYVSLFEFITKSVVQMFQDINQMTEFILPDRIQLKFVKLCLGVQNAQNTRIFVPNVKFSAKWIRPK